MTQPTLRTRFTVNGKPAEVTVPARMTLADCLRQNLRLTGTHLGCEHGVCGACTVIVDGDAVRACLMLAVQAEGADVVTVEGLSNDDALTPLQASFRKHGALQCGFCTPGMITTAHALLSEEPDADADRVREVLSGNLCRCTGYIPIVEACRRARRLSQNAARTWSPTATSAARSNASKTYDSSAAAENISTTL
jgi:carbon-monoxide dehydrogenase small subunit